MIAVYNYIVWTWNTKQDKEGIFIIFGKSRTKLLRKIIITSFSEQNFTRSLSGLKEIGRTLPIDLSCKNTRDFKIRRIKYYFFVFSAKKKLFRALRPFPINLSYKKNIDLVHLHVRINNINIFLKLRIKFWYREWAWPKGQFSQSEYLGSDYFSVLKTFDRLQKNFILWKNLAVEVKKSICFIIIMSPTLLL